MRPPRDELEREPELRPVLLRAVPELLDLRAPPDAVDFLELVDLRVPADLRAPVDLRVPVDLRAPPELLDALDRFAEERLEPVPDDLARVPPVLRLVDEERVLFFAREPLLRAPVEPLDDAERRPPPELSFSLSVHVPDSTRCAASATASAINEPRRDALDTTLLAACCALSAASTPASRILRRAAGLALIAAAAAANPAASISRLIAAFATLSIVLSFPPDEDEDFDPLRVLDFAIANLP